MIGIRVDANEHIASGHVMRCMAIAKKIKDNNEDVIFITADEYPKELIESGGYRVAVLKTKYDCMEEEVDKLQKLVEEFSISCLFVDSYMVTPLYFQLVKRFIKVVYMDDLLMFPYGADGLVNYAVAIKKEVYDKLYDDKKLPKLYLGSAYAPLREEFSETKAKLTEKVTDVFVTSGATDKFDVVLNLAKCVAGNRKFEVVKFHLISGMFNSNKEELRELANAYDNICVYENVKNMSEIMLKCQVAISAGGTTLMELAAVGLPTIAYVIADNQLSGTYIMNEEGILVYAGSAWEQEDIVGEILLKLEELMNDFSLREMLKRKAESVVDGNGADRIAKILCEI